MFRSNFLPPFLRFIASRSLKMGVAAYSKSLVQIYETGRWKLPGGNNP